MNTQMTVAGHGLEWSPHRAPRVLHLLVFLLSVLALVASTAPSAQADPALPVPFPNSFNTWNAGPPAEEGTLHRIVDQVTKASRFWQAGFTGAGVDIALVDTGVTPVRGLDDPSRLLFGPDISFDTAFENLRYLDLHGHGTHMASIIAGDEGTNPGRSSKNRSYQGVAPDARLVSVKVADGVGRADISQVIAGINWVVEHKNSLDLDIRVLVLAFGTDGVQPADIDPLTHAVEVAWRNGIVVVVAAGNDGANNPLRNPAYDPYVISVGAVETQGTYGSNDDKVLPFSNCGTAERSVDLLAPGKSVLGLYVPGSYIAYHYPEAQEGRLFRGTGTSQAAAVVAGSVALLLEQRPELTPDQVKQLLVATSQQTRSAPGYCAGAGVIDLGTAFKAETPAGPVQNWPTSTGLGSLEAARGSHHLFNDEGVLEGEVDVLGGEWDAFSWATLAEQLATWDGGDWNGNTWSGNTWSGNTWSTNTWSGNTWSTNTWSGNTWSGNTWSGNTWSGNTWSIHNWAGNTWSGNTWSGNTWSGNTWSGNTWSGNTWSGNTWSDQSWSGRAWPSS